MFISIIFRRLHPRTIIIKNNITMVSYPALFVAFLSSIAIAAPIHAAPATSSLFGDRDTLGTFVTTCVNQMTTRTLDSGGERSFRLNQNEWKVFEVYQDADETCDCSITCLDTKARVDLYVTFDRRPRLEDNWDGWDCKETLASHEQTCQVLVPEPDSTCRVAVHGYLFERRFSDCTLVCTVDRCQVDRGRC